MFKTKFIVQFSSKSKKKHFLLNAVIKIVTKLCKAFFQISYLNIVLYVLFLAKPTVNFFYYG